MLGFSIFTVDSIKIKFAVYKSKPSKEYVTFYFYFLKDRLQLLV